MSKKSTIPQLFILTIACSFWNQTNLIASQPPDTLWTKTFGGSNIDVGYSVQQTSDDGFIIAGYTRSFGTMSGRNVWLIKTDKFGNMMWNNAFGGNSDDEGNSVQQTLDGGYIIAGYTKSFGAGLNDVYLIKIDSLGAQKWSKTFGGAQDEEAYSVQQTIDGGFIIAGTTSSFGAGSRDVWLIKTDSSGNEVWKRTYGGLSTDGARSVSLTSDGGFIIIGWTFSYGPGAVGNLWLVKTDSLGNQQWHKYFGGSDVDRGYSVQQTTEGGFIVTGYTASFGTGNDDMYLVKTDSLGNEVWSKTFGGSGRDYGNSVQQTLDGGYIVAGYTLSFGAGGDDVWLVKTDPNGNQEWTKTFGGSSSDVCYCVRETSDGGYVLTGHTLSYGAGVHDVWLIRTATTIPVELISFSTVYSNGIVALFWSTASEKNNKGFEVERRLSQTLSNLSAARQEGEGLNEWTLIGFVEGNGTTTKTCIYSFEDKNLSAGKYSYRLKQIDFDGTFKYSDIVEIEFAPMQFSLEQNYPNPFNPSTKIRFVIPNEVRNPKDFSSQTPRNDNAFVTLKVYDVLGNEVATLVDEYKPAGSYVVEFSAKGGQESNIEYPVSSNQHPASGVYFYQLRAGDYVATKKMLLLR